MLLVEWLEVVCVSCLNRLQQDPSHARILEGIQAGATAARTFLKATYNHGLWWKQACSKFMLRHGQRFLKCYNFMAHVCLHELDGFAGYAMKPKLHMLSHSMFEIRNCLPHDRQASCLMSGCEANTKPVCENVYLPCTSRSLLPSTRSMCVRRYLQTSASMIKALACLTPLQ